jgi:hypothetical protein
MAWLPLLLLLKRRSLLTRLSLQQLLDAKLVAVIALCSTVADLNVNLWWDIVGLLRSLDAFGQGVLDFLWRRLALTTP